MLKKILDNLEEISRLAKTAKSAAELEEAIKKAKREVKEYKNGSNQELSVALAQLDGELETWQSKIGVIFKESVGRQGMEKHARHWAEKLKGL